MKTHHILTVLLPFLTFSSGVLAEIVISEEIILPKQCSKLFTETENLIVQAEKQPGTHPQVNQIKSKLKQSKEQILKMELAVQQKSCDVGLARLNSLKGETEQ